MKKYSLPLLCFLFLCFSQAASAQKVGVVWQKIFGNTGDDRATDVLVDADGSIVVIGALNQYGSSIDGLGSEDGMIIKLDPSGNLLWKIIAGGSSADHLNTIIATADGAYLCAGYTWSNDINISGYHGGPSDAWLIKISKQGNILWSKCYGGTKSDEAQAVVVTKGGDYAVVGTSISSDGDVLSGRKNRKDADGWVFKINPSGNLLWEKCLDYRDSGFNDRGMGIVETDDQQLFACVRGSLSSQPTPYYINTPGIAYLLNEATGNFSYFGSFNGYPGAIGSGEPYGGLDDPFSMAKGDSQYMFLFGETTDFTTVVHRESFDGLYVKRDTLPRYAGNGIPVPKFFFRQHGLLALPGNKFMIAGSSTVYGVPDRSNGCIYSSGDTTELGDEYYNEFFTSIKALPGNEGFVAVGVRELEQGNDWWVVQLVNLNKITGNVFVDANNNNIKDPDERNFNRALIKTSSTAGQYVTFPYNGVYRTDVGKGTFKTIASVSNPYYTVSTDSVTTVFNSYNNTATIDFAVHPIPGITDRAVSIIPLTRLRPGFSQQYKIVYANNGTDTLHDRDIVFVKNSHLHYVSAVPAYTSIAGDTLAWHIGNMVPDSTGSILVQFDFDIVPLVNIGDTIFSSISFDSTGDIMPADNEMLLSQQVRGSYDPNDKSESHGGQLSLKEAKAGGYLNYTIRFQNTGNDTAFTIIVRDTLDSKLDANNIEMLSASHPYQVELKDGKYITWTFKNIRLLDSLHNEPLSHGYIAYRIGPKAPVVIGDAIYNRASIYFDFNPAINTNTSITTISGNATNAIWTGAVSSAWENAFNWNNNKVPDENTAVKIIDGAPNYPQVSSNASCYSLDVSPAATVTVKTGFTLAIKGR